MTVIASKLGTEQVSDATAAAAAMVSTAKASISEKQFVYFAAFDGTNNDRDAIYKSGNPLDTNVAQLEIQVRRAYEATQNQNIRSGYFAGPGTGGAMDASAAIPTGKILEIAELAYADFAAEAKKWLSANPGGDVTAAFVSFSRGGAVAAAFAQLLYERGLVDSSTGQVLVEPGKIGISAGVSFDPVGTGVSGNVAFPGSMPFRVERDGFI